jgi:hypothetical protein
MSMEKGNGKRRLWVFQPFTICRILGLSFDERRLKKIFKALKLNHDNQFSADFEMHQSLAQICRTQSQPAKRVEKMLEKQFAQYKNEVERLDAQKISAIIEGRTENTLTNVPIPALIWFAVRNGGQDKELETRIFAAIHMKEHRALRFYDELALKLPGSKVEDITKQLEIAFKSNEKLQRRCERLEQKKEELISTRDAIKADKIRLIQDLEEQKRLTDRFQEQLKGMGGEVAYVQVEGLKKELEFLREERKRLNIENAELVKISALRFEPNIHSRDDVAKKFVASSCNCSSIDNGDQNEMENEMEARLKGVRVAYVGGVESLEPSYKEMAESYGCRFCYHCGHCEQGKKLMELLVEKNDVLFCPVDINSHNACRLVKEACKLRNKPCYFLRSSGLSALKKELLKFSKLKSI